MNEKYVTINYGALVADYNKLHGTKYHRSYIRQVHRKELASAVVQKNIQDLAFGSGSLRDIYKTIDYKWLAYDVSNTLGVSYSGTKIKLILNGKCTAEKAKAVAENLLSE